MIKKTKEISHSWGTETILTLDGGSIVRLYASEKKVTVQVAKAEEGDAVIWKWQDKYPSPTTTKVLGGLKEHKAMVAKMIHWFNQDKEGHTDICLISHDQTGQGCICGHGDDTMPD